ncbi:PREDICTED: uncharacterized protein LOC105625135, partial [Atta cephalotes]|uniref:Uncharacterized protein n=1 Tax=Atta cephalotes TaxID=12957 RepID=A0A158NWF8_ATTCE
MENCIVNESINNDFLSQSYSEDIERITRMKDKIFNFQISEKFLEVRKKTWDTLLNKYSKEMSDIEINIDTLEPVENEENKVVSEGEYSCGQRVPMRKPATFVQYWINTGNPPYKTLLDENELSEAGSSLSEKEIASLLISPVTNADKGTKCKNDSSCSSVDTAAYILSNANITKKADTIAIIKGAKCVEVKPLKEVAVKEKEVPSNNKIKYMEIIPRINRSITHKDNDNVNVDILDTEPYPMSTECMTADICGKVATSTLISSNAIQSNVYSQNLFYEETNKTDESNISQRNSNVQTIDNIASILRRFNKTSKRLIVNNKNNDVSDLDQNKVLEMDFHKKQVSENEMHEIIAKNTSLTTLHRKKLYIGRDSPVDLILTETHGANRLSGAKQSLHPALDLDDTIKGEPFLTRKGKSKHSFSAKTNLDSKKIKEREKTKLNCISNEIITEISNKDRNDKIQDTIIDSSFKNLSDFHDNSNKQDDIMFRENNDINISVRNEDFSKQNVASLNLKPVVILERIQSFNRYDFSASNAEKKDDKLSNLKDTGVSHHNKELHVEGLPSKNYSNAAMESDISNKTNAIWQNVLSNKSKTHSYLHERNDVGNVKLREIKIVLERLPLSVKNCTSTMMEMQVFNRNNAAKNNVKLQEIRVLLERLPANTCLKENSNVTNINIFPNKKISHNTELQTNKRESKIRKISKSLACKNEVAVPSVRNNYSSKMNVKFKKDNDKINDTYDIVTQHGNLVFDKVESEFTFQNKTFRYKNCSKASQDDRGKYSILTFTSSDEDDFVRSIHPRKKSKVSTNDILDEPNNISIAEKDLYDQTELVISDKDKYSYRRNLSTVIHSSEKIVQRDTGLIKKKKEHNNNVQTRTTSLELLRNKKFVFSSSESDNDNVTDNSNKAKKKILFFDSKENISNNSLRHSNGAIKKNGIDCKDNAHVIIFQTKTFDTNSSDSEESNNYTSPTRKMLTNSIHNRLRYHDSINSKEIFNDSLAKKYSKRHLGSLNSSLEKHNRTHNGKTKFKSIKEVKTNKQLAKESNSDIKLRIDDTRKNASFSSLINNRPVTSVQKTILSNTLEIFEETNLSKNKEISEKSKNSVAIQQNVITST